jgi:hypothetical protein
MLQDSAGFISVAGKMGQAGTGAAPRSGASEDVVTHVAAVVRSGHDQVMRAVVATNNPVRLSFLVALLADAGIETVLLDTHASIADGSIGAIPRRLMVAQDDYDRARRILHEAGEC